jgi:hypothetical protein
MVQNAFRRQARMLLRPQGSKVRHVADMGTLPDVHNSRHGDITRCSQQQTWGHYLMFTTADMETLPDVHNNYLIFTTNI